MLQPPPLPSFQLLFPQMLPAHCWEEENSFAVFEGQRRNTLGGHRATLHSTKALSSPAPYLLISS